MQYQKDSDAQVAKILNDLHEKEAAKKNTGILEPEALKIGDVVWYNPERALVRDKLQPDWTGPGIITEKRGEHSYVVEIQPGDFKAAHRDQLKLVMQDLWAEKSYPLHYFARKAPPVEPVLGPGEYIAEKILDYKFEDGQLKFLVKWRGYPDPTWEPFMQFLNETLQPYSKTKGLVPSLEIVS